MNKDLLSPLAVFATLFVGVAFLVVLLFVFFTKGNSKFWIDKKMRLGGILLSLSAIINSGCGMFGQDTCYDIADHGDYPEPMCYDVPCSNVVKINIEDFVKDPANGISGYIENPNTDVFSYALINNTTSDTLQKGDFNLNSADTVNYERTFTVKIDKTLAPGNYRFYVCSKGDFSNQLAYEIITIKD